MNLYLLLRLDHDKLIIPWEISHNLLSFSKSFRAHLEPPAPSLLLDLKEPNLIPRPLYDNKPDVKFASVLCYWVQLIRDNTGTEWGAISHWTLTAWRRIVVQMNDGDSQLGVYFGYCSVDSVL